MPHIKKLTPNLIVSNVERSLAFYEGVLGFARGMTVPEQSPYVFASVTSGSFQIFFNDEAAVAKESAQLAGKARGGGNTMFIEIDDDIDAYCEQIRNRVHIVLPLVNQWYGMREFGIEDPDGYVITFAQPVKS